MMDSKISIYIGSFKLSSVKLKGVYFKKKSLLCIFTLCIVFVALCSCNKLNQNITDATDSKISGVVETPADHQSYSLPIEYGKDTQI